MTHRRHNSGCGTVVLGAFLVALVPASFATPGMWWVGVILMAVGLLALSGYASAHRRRRPVFPVTRSFSGWETGRSGKLPRIFYRAHCGHCGAPRGHGAASCRYCGADLTAA